MTKDLIDAIAQLLSTAQTAFTISDAPADIKQSAGALRVLLKEWRVCDARVESVIGGLLELVQSRCKHVGVRRGHNERDGSWMAACPTCGASE